MRLFHTALPILAAASLLAGCNAKPSANDPKSAAGAADAQASGASSSATPANLAVTPTGAPKRRDGYWEMSSYSSSGYPMSKNFYCVGAGSEDRYSIFDALAEVGGCSKRDFTRTATGWTFDTVCKLMDTVTHQAGTISGDFQQSFVVNQTVTSVTGKDTTEMKGSIRGKRIGDCPAKYKPGDLIDKDGETLGNLLSH